MDALEVYYETEKCLSMINDSIKKNQWRFDNAWTIRQSNNSFKKVVEKAKEEAFETVKGIIKPYVVYRVNKHYYSLLN